ncbi:MAG: hypothetical protein MUE71_07480 [Chitinophagaceae bacterium]|jgi:uncharacterized repeat protein (TIGR03806 family)|nr:hypothetical protein [Chitinophagaceae bacterium]
MMKTIIPVLFALAGLGSFQNKKVAPASKPLEKLSQYGFFSGNLQYLNPVQGVIPYGLHTPLFSNYAEKQRFIKLPEGTKAMFHPTEEFDLPAGTYLIKNFFYPNDFRDPKKGRRILETRLMYKDETGWQTWPFIWNDEQTDAVYDPAGENKNISYIDEKGRKIEANYLVPNKNQCKGCHMKGNEVVPIGIAARHLNSSYSYEEGEMNQLKYWQQKGMLTGMPDSNIAANAHWQDKNISLNDRARAYLDINCGHCHRPDGAAGTSGLFLHAQETNTTALGIMKTPVAAGRGSGGRRFDIVPGKPDASILLYRMQTNDPGIAMPEIGREQLHAEGIALIKEWIKQMK